MSVPFDLRAAQEVLHEVLEERARQHEKRGEQNFELGFGSYDDGLLSVGLKDICDKRTAAGTVTFRDILAEEVYEAMSENEPARAREELIQVAATAVQIIEAIDRKAVQEQEMIRARLERPEYKEGEVLTKPFAGLF